MNYLSYLLIISHIKRKHKQKIILKNLARNNNVSIILITLIII